VIVEQAADARARDVQELVRQKSQSKEKALKDLLSFCEKIDKTSDGMLSIGKVMGAYKRSAVFRELMTAMGMTNPALQGIFQIADPKCTGLIDYNSFSSELFHLKCRDLSMLLVQLRFNMQATQDMLKEITPQLEELAKQDQMFSAQVNVLDHKREQLVLSATLGKTQEENLPEATLQEIGARPAAQTPW